MQKLEACQIDMRQDIATILVQLRHVHGSLEHDAAETQKKVDQFDTLHNLTPAQEAEADKLAQLLDNIESMSDAVDAAIFALETA